MNSKQQNWEKWNKQLPKIVFTTEQTILWLEGMRELLFEVWRNDKERVDQWHAETKKLREQFNKP
ncbi:MAG: hypothetical protein HQM16_15765 [Deltaproteobacteria bacterium]|nr:hypothetical protein [Deltaproteobacteria bacterium]